MNKRNEIKTGYIQTEIGRIPKEWEVVELGTCIDVFSGYAFKREDFLTNKSKGVPIIKIGNLQNGKVIIDDKTSFVPRDFYEKLFDFQLHYGDVLIALSGATTGKIAVVDKDIGLALVNQRVGKFKILNSNISQKFFYFLAQSDNFKKFVLRNIGQSAQGNLSPNQVKKSKIPLPPLPEQQKIAEILSTVDSAIEKVNQAIARTQRLKKGLMQELLTKGIGHKEFKDTEIGRIPKEWEVIRLKESKEIDLIMGQSPPGKSYNKKGEGLPFIQGKAEFGNMYPSPILWTTQPTKIAEEGDILISVRAPVGDVNICPYRLCIGRGLAAIRIKEGSNIFYFYWFQKEKQRIESIGKGSTFKAITKDELSNIFIPFPSLPEQQKIAEILSTVDKRLELLRNKKEKMERVKKGLMNDLLTGKRRVKV